MVLAGVLLQVIVAIFGGAAGIPSAREVEAIPWVLPPNAIPRLREADDLAEPRSRGGVPSTREADAIPLMREPAILRPEPWQVIPSTREEEEEASRASSVPAWRND